MYILTQKFIDFLSTTPASDVQLEHALDQFAKTNHIRCITSQVPSLSLKYAWDIFAIISYLFSSSSPKAQVHPSATVHPTAVLTGQVIIEEGAKYFHTPFLKDHVMLANILSSVVIAKCAKNPCLKIT